MQKSAYHWIRRLTFVGLTQRRLLRSPAFDHLALCAVCLLHMALVLGVVLGDHAVLDEYAHLASGIHHLKTGDYALYAVNPPLVMMLAAVPVILAGTARDSFPTGMSPHHRPEFMAGYSFAADNGISAVTHLVHARLMCAFFGCLICLVGFHWARELHGRFASLAFPLLVSTCPTIVTYSAKVLPDAGGAAFGFLAAYCAWRWFRHPSIVACLLYGISLALACATKSTCLVIGLIVPLLFALDVIRAEHHRAHHTQAPRSLIRFWWHLVVANLVGLALLSAVYEFSESFRPLSSYSFRSELLSGNNGPGDGGNRFLNTPLSSLPVPFPAKYVEGVDIQLREFEDKKWSYLRGKHKFGGWWYYYLYCGCVKLTLGSLALAVIAGILIAGSPLSMLTKRFHHVPFVVGLSLLVLISSATGFSRHFRYALPCLPFFYLFLSSVYSARYFVRRCVYAVATGCVALHLLSSLLAYPHFMSYFNELAGGPRGGWKHLADSNVDWGQDLLYLKRWYEQHPGARPFHVAYFGERMCDPGFLGIHGQQVPTIAEIRSSTLNGNCCLQPGWYAVSVNHLAGYRHTLSDCGEFTYFTRFTPKYYAGYSIYVYHLDESDVMEVCRDIAARG